LHVYDVSNLPGDCDNNWVLSAADITAFNDSDYAVNYPGLGDPNAPDGSTAFHFDVNCDGVVGDPNDLARLTALTGPNPPADCRSALPDCPE